MRALPRTRYDAVAMIIHWVTAVLMIYMVFFGEDLMKSGARLDRAGDTVNAPFQPSIHVSIGITILLLTVLRIIWRLTHASPPYPATMKRYEVIGSRALHGLFYVLLILIPLTGLIGFATYAERFPSLDQARIFGAMQVPQFPIRGGLFLNLHGLGSNIAMFLIGLHVLAALKHQFYDRDGIFARIVPGMKG